MASKSVASIALFLSLNLIFFSMASSRTGSPLPTPSPSNCPPNLDVCARILSPPGSSTNNDCCPLIPGIINLEIYLCLCDIIEVDLPILGTNINATVAVNLILNYCGRNPANYDFSCN
ncbi:hypothetical protein CR513_63116, partial [Mucuna pruriens]